MLKTKVIIQTGLITLFLLPTHGMAQEDDIIITAARRAEQAREYAGSVSTFDAERLRALAVVHPAELLNEAAGVNIHRGSGQEHLTAIRSPVLTGGAGAGSFLYLEDGVPLRAAGFGNVNGLFESAIDLAERVEVSKGPGSVLYGSNAVHGLINVLSPAPLTDNGTSLDLLGNENGYVRLLAGNDGAALNGRYHIGLSLTHDPGFRADSGFDQQKLQIRHDTNLGRWTLKTLASFQNLNQETAGFIRGNKAYKDKALVLRNPNPEAFRDAKSARFALHFNRESKSGNRLSFIPYGRWVDLSFLRHFVPGKALEESGHQSLGLISTYEGAIKGGHFTLGLDSEFTKGRTREFQAGPRVFSFVQGEHYDYAVKALVLSPYGQLRFDLGAKTKLNLGVRADYTRYDYNNRIDNGSFGRFLRIADRQDDYFTLAPKAGLTHQINDHVSLYGRYARGNRAPQVSDAFSLQINQTPGAIRPETLDSFEAGLKAITGAIRFDLSLYAMRKNNFFFRNANGFNVENGKTHHKGVEIEFTAPLGRYFTLSGAASYAEHTYAFTDSVRTASSSIRKGTPVDSAPKTLGFVQIMVRPTDALSLSAKLHHAGKYFTDPGNTARYEGHDIVTLRGTAKLSPRLSFYGRVDNLLDTRYANRADFAFGSERYFPGRPRTVFFGVRIKS